MTNITNMALILELLESAEKNLKTIQQLLSGELTEIKKHQIPSNLSASNNGTSRMIEGIFDGQNMLGADEKIYPVIANYASKSKLVEGDHLKLTILEDGSFIFKQIFPVPRKSIVGVLTYDDGKYKVLAGGKIYRVLNASVTYYKAKPGDEVTLIVNASDENALWGALDNVITATNNIDDNKVLNFDIDTLNKKKKKNKSSSQDDIDSTNNEPNIDYQIDL